MSLLGGVKRTCAGAGHMSAFDPKRTCHCNAKRPLLTPERTYVFSCWEADIVVSLFGSDVSAIEVGLNN